MAFIFSTSHLPETRVRRPDHLEEEEDEDGMQQPPPRAGMVRAFSHLPVKEETADPAGPLSQRGAQAIGHQLQRTETQDTSRAHSDGIAAAKASGVFDAVRQQFNRGDSPHFMDEDGNLRPRDEARMQDSPALRDPRSPQFGAGAPPRPAWGTGHAAGADASSSRIPRAPSPASEDTRPWHTPAIPPGDLDPQHFDDDEATGSHSALKGRPEAQDLVYRIHGESQPKPEFQDLLYRFRGNPEEVKDHRRDYIQNVADAADSRGHTAQQTKTYGAAPDSHGYANTNGSGSQPSATGPTTRPWNLSDFVTQGKIAQEEATKKWNQVRNPEDTAEPAVKADPTVKELEQEERRLEGEVKAAWKDLHQNREAIKRLKGIRMSVDAAAQGIELAKNGFPDGLDVPFDFMMEKTGLDPKIQIEKMNAEISEREKNILALQEKIATAQGNLVDARARTKVAKDAKKKMELEKNQKQPTAQQT